MYVIIFLSAPHYSWITKSLKNRPNGTLIFLSKKGGKNNIVISMMIPQGSKIMMSTFRKKYDSYLLILLPSNKNP
jgi:hypothetical protein